MAENEAPAVKKDMPFEAMRPPEKMTFLERKLRAIMPRFETMLGDPEKAKMLVYVALNALRKEPKLLNCTPESFIRSINHCSDIGLFPNTPENHAYLIPFGTECQVMIDYKGYIALAHQVPKVVKIWAELVYKGDEFRNILGADPDLIHVPDYDVERTLENLIGAYAVVKYSDGDKQWVYMTRKELDKVKAVSKAKNKSDSPWVTWPEEQYRKCPLRRLMKFVPWSPHMMKAVALDNAATVGESQDMPMVTAGAKEAEFEVVGDETPKPTKSEKMAEELKGKARNGKPMTESETFATATETLRDMDKKPDVEALRKELTDLLESNADVLGPELLAHYPVGRIKLWKADALQDAIDEVNKQLVAVGQSDDGDSGPELPL